MDADDKDQRRTIISVTGSRGQGKTLATMRAAALANPEGFTLEGYAECPRCGEGVRSKHRNTREALVVEDLYKEFMRLGPGHASPSSPPSPFVVPTVVWTFEPHGWLRRREPRICQGSDALIFTRDGWRGAADWASRVLHRVLKLLRIRGEAWGPLAPPPPPGFRVARKKETLYIPTQRP